MATTGPCRRDDGHLPVPPTAPPPNAAAPTDLPKPPASACAVDGQGKRPPQGEPGPARAIGLARKLSQPSVLDLDNIPADMFSTVPTLPAGRKRALDGHSDCCASGPLNAAVWANDWLRDRDGRGAPGPPSAAAPAPATPDGAFAQPAPGTLQRAAAGFVRAYRSVAAVAAAVDKRTFETLAQAKLDQLPQVQGPAPCGNGHTMFRLVTEQLLAATGVSAVRSGDVRAFSSNKRDGHAERQAYDWARKRSPYVLVFTEQPMCGLAGTSGRWVDEERGMLRCTEGLLVDAKAHGINLVHLHGVCSATALWRSTVRGCDDAERRPPPATPPPVPLAPPARGPPALAPADWPVNPAHAGARWAPPPSGRTMSCRA